MGPVKLINNNIEKQLNEDYIEYKEDSDLLNEEYVREVLLWEKAFNMND